MSVHYLLDGYNILQKTPGLSSKKLEDGRREFVRLIQVHRPQGSVHNKITIVFDGKEGYWQDDRPDGVEVIFSTIGSADDKIKEIVDRRANKKELVVVTDDKALKLYVRGLGAGVLSVLEFQSRFKTVALTPKINNIRVSKDVDRSLNQKASYTQMHAINKELEEIWVKKKKNNQGNS